MDVLIDSRTSHKLPNDFKDIILIVINKTVALIDENPNREVSISIVDADEIRDLNRRFRNTDKETDVLSFPSGDREASELGDIIISAPLVYSQAELFGHSAKRELGFLVAHGMLHLLGYDHETQEDDLIMRGLQTQVMCMCGLDMLP